MASKKPTPDKTAQLPGITGNGVAPLVIAEVSKAVTKYERAKEKRCQASPGEIAAKRELQAALHKHVEKLPKNGDGLPFYQLDEVQYVLEERLVLKRAGGDDSAGE